MVTTYLFCKQLQAPQVCFLYQTNFHRNPELFNKQNTKNKQTKPKKIYIDSSNCSQNHRKSKLIMSNIPQKIFEAFADQMERMNLSRQGKGPITSLLKNDHEYHS